jgi:hypothetical protein
MMLNIAHELTWRYFNAVRLTCPVPAVIAPRLTAVWPPAGKK